MKRLYIISTLFLALGFFLTPLGAQETSGDFFRSGRIFLDLSGGASKPSSPVLKAMEKDQNALAAALIMATSQNQERQLFGLYQLSQVGKGSSSAVNGRLGLEFALTDWFGLGPSIESTSVTVKNVYPFSDLALLTTFLGGTTTGITALDLLSFQKVDVKMEPLNTLNLDLGFHFPGTARMDPYFRLTLGAGSTSGASILKGGAALGLRYALAGDFYLGYEIYGNAMTLVAGAQSQGGGAAANVSEAGARISFGYAF